MINSSKFLPLLAMKRSKLIVITITFNKFKRLLRSKRSQNNQIPTIMPKKSLTLTKTDVNYGKLCKKYNKTSQFNTLTWMRNKKMNKIRICTIICRLRMCQVCLRDIEA